MRFILSNGGTISIFQEANKTSFEEPQQAVAEESEPTIPEATEAEATEEPETEPVESEPTTN